MNQSSKKHYAPLRKLAILVCIFGSLILSHCQTGIGGSDLMGIFYNDVVRSESRDTVIGLKYGEACQVSFLSLFAIGDNSIPNAARNGAVREVLNITFRNQGVLFGALWAKSCTIVYGR